MRRRRADRCVLRASAALDADVPDAAQAVLAEAEALCPEHPELPSVAGRLHAAVAPRDPATPLNWIPVVVAAMLLSLFAAGGW